MDWIRHLLKGAGEAGAAGGADKDRTFQVEGTNGWSTHT